MGDQPAAEPVAESVLAERRQMLNAIFGEVLGVTQVADDKSFFELGGQSLLAGRLVSRVRDRLGVELSVATVFEHPSVNRLATQLTDPGVVRSPLQPASRDGELPLAPVQLRLWFLNRLHGANNHYNMWAAFRLSGELDVAALRAAVNDLVAKHESLRAVYPDWTGSPQQVVLDPEDAVVDLPLTPAGPGSVEQLLTGEIAYPFDLTAETPLRGRLFRLAPDEHILCLVIHHIACDGWSLNPMLRDLGRAYDLRIAGSSLPADLKIQYPDFAVWQAELLEPAGEARSLAERQLEFWRRELQGVPVPRPLEGMRPRPMVPSHQGHDLAARIPAQTHQAVLDLARETGTSPFMIFHSVLVALLRSLGAGDDVAIGTPVAGRADSALDELVGFFVNTLVLRVRVADDPTFLELLARTRGVDLAAFAHQDLPFDFLVQQLNPPRQGAWPPMFNVMLAYQNTEPAELALDGLRATPEPVLSEVARFDLRVEVVERFGAGGEPLGIDLTLTRALDVTTEEVGESLLAGLRGLLDEVLARPRRRVSSLGRATAERGAGPPAGRPADQSGNPLIGFVCAPFGQQWAGMGRRMFQEEPVFRAAIEECDQALSTHVGWSLIDELAAAEPDSRLDDVSIGQPAVFAIQVAIANWLEHRGLRPTVVVGHSLGEIAGCVIAGMLELPQAARLVVHYSAQQRLLAGRGGGMLVAEAAAPWLQSYLDDRGASATVATSNGPRTTALAGDRDELTAIMADLRERDVLCALIRVDLAAHSTAIDEIVPDLLELTSGLRGRPGRYPVVSSLTGQLLDWRDLTPEYFAANLRRPVRLTAAIEQILTPQCGALVEISAHPILVPALWQSVHAQGSETEVLASMRRSDDDREALVELVGSVHAATREGP